MFSRAPLQFELGLELEACMCPQQLVQFWLTMEIEGFISTYVMTRKYNCVLFHLSPGILLSNHKSNAPNTSDNPCIYIPSLFSWPQDSGEQEPEGGFVQVPFQWWVRTFLKRKQGISFSQRRVKNTDIKLAFCDLYWFLVHNFNYIYIKKS